MEEPPVVVSSDFNDYEVGMTFKDTNLERSLTRQYVPGSMGNLGARPIHRDVGGTAASVLSTTVLTIPASSITTTGIRTRPPNKFEMYMDPEYAVFVGDTSDPVANILPGGTSIDYANWLMYGPITTEYSQTGYGPSKDYDFIDRFVFVNGTAFQHIVTIYRVLRYIANGGDYIQ